MKTNFEKNAPELANFLGMGFYRVNSDGKFIECDITAKKIFSIPINEGQLSKYSIEQLYIIPAERKKRINNLRNNLGKPISGILSLHIKGKAKLVLDICWNDDSSWNPRGCIGLVANITDYVIFPKMFENFPMGMYEVDDQNTLIRVNKGFAHIFGFSIPSDIIGKHLRDFYKNIDDLHRFSKKVTDVGFAHEILALRDRNDNILEVEVFSQRISGPGAARWGMVTDVTKRERYYRALDAMPTGYYHIDYDEKGNEPITQLNNAFAGLFGFQNIKAAKGVSIKELYAREEDETKFLEALKTKDQMRKPLLNYELDVKRLDNGKIFTISIDSHIVRDFSGNITGREGTVRDISSETALKREVERVKGDLEQTTADINKLIHAFLHPVLKFYANAELFLEIAKILSDNGKSEATSIDVIKELGGKLESMLTNIVHDFSINDEFVELKEELNKARNVLNYRLQEKRSLILLDKAVRDTALHVLEELNKSYYLSQKGLKTIIHQEFIEMLQNILSNYLIRSTKILIGETKIMRQQVEALRRYLGMKKRRGYIFKLTDLGLLLEENVELFQPIFSQKLIRITYKESGNLNAELSENDIDRLICNLLHNAEKYSFTGTGRYIAVEAKELREEDSVEFSIQSYGIPIKREELQSGYIYTFGGRGEFAYSKDRAGTGVGLTDAKETVEAHGGFLDVTSEPVVYDGDPPRYKVAYRTTVKARFPKKVSKEKKQ